MGCDIHAVIEFQEQPGGDWWELCVFDSLTRNYRAFAALAGVRDADGNGPPPRGLPKGTSYDLFLGQHSHSWIDSVDELRRVIEQSRCDWDWRVMLHTLESAKAFAHDARLVFGFDS